jgi:multiple antibiotic resistance protein
MSAFVSYVLLSIGSLFSVVDPFAAVPIFLVLVGSQPFGVQAKTALRASATCFAVLTAFGVAGTWIFGFFGITLPAFKISGGVLLFGVALDMMRGKRSDTRATTEEAADAAVKEDVGLIPLGIPLLSGPGAIATVMVLVGRARDFQERASVFTAVALVSLLTFLTLRWAPLLARVLGTTGMNVIGRVMGLILGAVAMQFVIDGLHGAFPHLLADK